MIIAQSLENDIIIFYTWQTNESNPNVKEPIREITALATSYVQYVW